MFLDLNLLFDHNRVLPARDLKPKNYENFVSDFGVLDRIDNYKQLICRGGFGSVYRYKSTIDGQNYALKIQRYDDENLYNAELQEVKIFLELPQHKNVISIRDYYTF